MGTPDCIFLPISNCPVPSTIDGEKTIRIPADLGLWKEPINPSVFKNRSFNWYRTQVLFYVIRFKPELLAHIQNEVARYFNPPSIDLHHQYIALYVRRSDKVQTKEMAQSYSLQQYFDLFDNDARQAKINTIYINSEDEKVYNEFNELNEKKDKYYKLLRTNATRNVNFMSLMSNSGERRKKLILEFLTDLFIEVNADLHAGTLTSNWCRIVDEIKFVLGKMVPYYTPENRYIID